MTERVARLRPSDWGEVRLYAALAVAIVSIAVGVAALAIGVHNETRIIHDEARVTKVEKSACAKNPVHPNAVCEEDRQELARNESIISACISNQRVTGIKGANCPRFYVNPAHGGTAGDASPSSKVPARHASSQEPESGTGVMPSTPSTGHSQPGPSGGRPTESGAPESHGESALIERSESTVDNTAESTAKVPAELPKAPVTEAVGSTVEEVTHTAGGTVEGTQETTCSLAGLLCP